MAWDISTYTCITIITIVVVCGSCLSAQAWRYAALAACLEPLRQPPPGLAKGKTRAADCHVEPVPPVCLVSGLDDSLAAHITTLPGCRNLSLELLHVPVPVCWERACVEVLSVFLVAGRLLDLSELLVLERQPQQD